MIKFEVKSTNFEIRLPKRGYPIDYTAQDVFSEVTNSAYDGVLLGSFDSEDDARKLFDEEKKWASSDYNSGHAFPFISGKVYWIERNTYYDDDGEFDQGEIIAEAAAPFHRE